MYYLHMLQKELLFVKKLFEFAGFVLVLGTLAPQMAGAVLESPLPMDSEIISTSNIPTTMIPGERRTVSITFKNTGAGPYYDFSTSLRSYPAEDLTWGVKEIPYTPPPSACMPGCVTTFTFEIIAPSLPGVYSFYFLMHNTSAFYSPVGYFGDMINSSITVSAPTPPPPPTPTLTLIASPTSVPYGNPSTLSWYSSNVTSCTASASPTNPNWSGPKPTWSDGQSTGALTTTTTFTLACSGSYGSISKSVTVSVSPPTAPTVTLDASPKSVAYGGSTTLSWSSINATSCSASALPANPAWAGTKGLSGSQTITGLNTTTTFTITCTDSSMRSASKSVDVTVTGAPLGPPVVTFSADPEAVTYGGSTTLSWSSTGASSCTASSDPANSAWTGAKDISGSQVITGLVSTTIFTVTCTGSGGPPATSRVTVTVGAPLPSVSLTASPSSVPYAGRSTLSWTSSGAVSCEATNGPWSGPKAWPSGSESTSALVTSTTYEITCRDSLGNLAKDSATVSVGPSTFTIDLKVNLGSGYVDEGSGVWPLANVDLKGITGGSAGGPITYKFYCDASLSPTLTETIITEEKPHIREQIDLCDYDTQGRYTAKLFAIRAGVEATDLAEIVVAKSCALVEGETSRRFAKVQLEHPEYREQDITSFLKSIIIAILPARTGSL